MGQGDNATRLQAGPCAVWTEGQCYRPDLPSGGSAGPSIQYPCSAWLLGLPAMARPSPAFLGHSAPVAAASLISAFFLTPGLSWLIPTRNASLSGLSSFVSSSYLTQGLNPRPLLYSGTLELSPLHPPIAPLFFALLGIEPITCAHQTHTATELYPQKAYFR